MAKTSIETVWQLENVMSVLSPNIDCQSNFKETYHVVIILCIMLKEFMLP